MWDDIEGGRHAALSFRAAHPHRPRFLPAESGAPGHEKPVPEGGSARMKRGFANPAPGGAAVACVGQGSPFPRRFGTRRAFEEDSICETCGGEIEGARNMPTRGSKV